MSTILIPRNAHVEHVKSCGCKCETCPISNSSEPQSLGTVAVDSNGIPDTSGPFDGIIVVGEIPTFNDKHGPLSGRAKRNWQEALEKSGLNGKRLLLVPTVHCVPNIVLKKSDRAKIVNSCRPSALSILAKWPNTPMLLMGSDAMESIGLNKKITANRGFLHKGIGGRPYIITYAATTVMFGNIYMWGTFIEDLRRFNRLITNTLKPGLDPSMVKIHATDDIIHRFLDSNLNKPISVDIETTAPAETPEWGLDPNRASLKTIALGVSDSAVSFAWSLADYSTRSRVAAMLGESSRIKVFHNGPWFDLRVLERYGVIVRRWEDTRDLRRAISSTSRLSLGYLGSLYCDIHAWKLDDNNDKLASSNNLDELLLYNGYDTIVTARIYEAMKTGAGL